MESEQAPTKARPYRRLIAPVLGFAVMAAVLVMASPPPGFSPWIWWPSKTVAFLYAGTALAEAIWRVRTGRG